MKHRHLSIVVLAMVIVLLGVTAYPLDANPITPLKEWLPSSLAARDAVEAAWQRATEVGAYAYATDIVQTTWPLARLENAGLGSQTERLYVEGETDVAARAMQLKLWSEGGSAATGQNSVEVRVAQDQAWGRVGDGEWEALKDGAVAFNLFAPGGDPLGYLATAQDIARLDAQTRAGVTFERYSFRLDGPMFAAHMRDLMEAELARKGELPPGLSLDMARIYLEMTGTGEIWLDSAGLPLRLMLNVKFPPDSSEQVEATITTDFTGWKTDAATGTSGATKADFSRAALAKIQEPGFRLHLLLLATVLAGVGLLITCRAPQLYAAVVIAVIVSMVATPLLQGQQVYAFNRKQTAARAEFAEQQAVRQKQAALEADLSHKDFDPQRDPLAGRAAAPINTPLSDANAPSTTTLSPANSACDALDTDTGADTDADGLTDVQEACIETDFNLPDTDADGLSDSIEVYELGLDPTEADSDGDDLPDGVEVQGFVDGFGKQWYLNPLDADTNGDGLPDGIECQIEAAALTCPDTNLDGTPDVFDFDDDNDDVPDKLDAAPTLVMGEIKQENGRAVVTGLQDQVFKFALDQLAVDQPAYVDFQLRPVNPEHLWYTLNVLDWPADDREGQVQRVYTTTFGASGQEANGDLRLIPMLELEIPYHDGQYGYLPVKPGAPAITYTTPITAWLDTAQMDMFGISVRAKDQTGEVLLAYAPLVVMQDEYGAKVSFTARMFYRPSVSAPGALQEARLVWLLLAKTDSCTIPENLSEDAAKTYCNGLTHWVETSARIIHTYYDDWYLTGLSVREDHGLDVGVIFEDPDYAIGQPDYDADTYYEGNLWQLATGLDQSFIAGRDDDADGVRDITVEKIAHRFDRDLNAGVTFTESWGLDQSAFQVVTTTFPHQSYLGVVPMTTTKQILADYFTNGTLAKIQAPTLLYVREERFRFGSLDGFGTATQAGILHANHLTASLAIADFPATTLSGMSWAPFRYAGAGVWGAYSPDEYLSHLDAAVRPWLQADSDLGSDPYVLDGAVIVATAFYLSIMAGVNSVVEFNGTVTPLPYSAGDIVISYAAATGLGTIAKTVVSKIAEMQAEAATGQELLTKTVSDNGKEVLKDLGQQKAGEVSASAAVGRSSTFKTVGKVLGVMLLAVVAVALITAVIGEFYEGEYVRGATYIIKAATVVMSIRTVTQTAATVKAAGGFLKALGSTTKAALKAAAIAALVTLVVTAVVAVGLFVYEMIKGDVDWGSLEFNQALANMVATIIVAVILLAIGLIPVIGIVIIAVISLIDAVIALVCMYFGLDEEAEMQNFCAGINGLLVRWTSYLIYDQTPLIDMAAPDRMQVQHLNMGLVDAVKGIVAGARLDVSADILTTLYRDAPDGDHWPTVQFTDENIDDSTFRYKFVPVTTTLPVALREMEEEWISTGYTTTDTERYTTTQYIENNTTISLTQPGINRETALYLLESYAINVQECVVFSATCKLREKADATPIYLGDQFIFDVFPDTLDGFYELADRGNRSYALAWDARFPTLADADGDGLRSSAAGGNDPDDGAPDSDVDGLPDWYEVQYGLDPMRPDGDGDGLEDYWEVFYETDPYHADTDNDGLTDKEELDGWEYVYAFRDDGGEEVSLITRVTSDPNDPDPDGDGITDKLEQVYGFNPNVYSAAAVLGITAVVDDPDGIVAPGATVAYTATVQNYLRDRYALGLLEVEFPAAVQDSDIEPRPYTLPPSQTTTLNGQLTLRPDITTSYQISLTNRAGANIADLRGEAAGRAVWLHLNEVTGTTTFADASLNGNDGTCITCPVAGQAGYAGLAPYFDGVNDFISLGNPTNVPSDGVISLLAWIKPEATDSLRNILDHGIVGDHEVYMRMMNGYYEVGSWDGVTAYMARYAIPPGDLGQWVHLAGVYDGSRWILYRNGREVARQTSGVGALPVDGDWVIGARGDLPERFFRGWIDEVEIFPRALLPEEVSRYVQEPVLHVKLDEAAAPFSDSSADHNTITCAGAQCPTGGQSAPVGQGVAFNQKQYLLIGSSSSLDLSRGAGRFSLAAWVKPYTYTVYVSNANKNDPVWEGWYGILGNEENSAYSYPTLYVSPDATRLGLRFGGTPSACGYQTVAPILTPNQWQHVGVTFDGDLITFYINGVAVDTSALCSGQTPPGGIWLFAGRPNAQGYLYFDHVFVNDEDDGLGSAEYAIDNGAGTTIWWNDYIQSPVDHPIYVSRLIPNDSGAAFVFCEDDEPEYAQDHLCDTNPEQWPGNDDDIMFNVRRYPWEPGSYAWYWNGIGGPDGGPDGIGTLYFQQDNDYYKGGLDDLRIYPYALTDVQMDDLYTGMQRILELRFDEAPGRSIFADSSGNASVGVCSGATCPDSGLPGRANQAARFDGVDDYVDVSLDVPESDYTLSLWFKTTCADCGIYSVVSGGGADHDRHVYLSGGNLCTRVYQDETICTSGASYADGQWHHFAHVIGASIGGQKIYVDSVEAQSGVKTGSDFTWQTGVYIGYSFEAAQDYFDGWLDHVVIINKAVSAAEVVGLMHEAPSINLHLDEPLVEAATGVTTTVFANAANPSAAATCELTPTVDQCGCPAAGLDGWMRNAIVFDSAQYTSDAPQCLALDSASTPESFTVGGWFRPTRQRWIGDQILIGKAGSFELTLLRGSLHVKFDVTEDTRAPQAIDSIVSPGNLLLNQWNHVVATYGDGQLTLYINGRQEVTGTLPTRKTTDRPITIGNQFVGMADEVFMVDMALDGRAVTDLYQYQAAWYDAAFSHDLTIDADAPTVRLDHPNPFIPLQPGYVLAAAAHDVTSAIVGVDYRLNGGATWTPAQRDREAWAFAITPTVEGDLTIFVRATDGVGHTAEASQTLTADGTPPEISMTVEPGVQEASATLHLSGVATDTLSGVSAVYVTVLDPGSAPLGGTELATLHSLSGSDNTQVAWEVNYSLTFPANGHYTIHLRAVDAVNNDTQTDVLRRPQSTHSTQYALTLDGTAPFADVTASGPTGVVLSGTAPLPVLAGAAFEAPYPTGQTLFMHLEETGAAFSDASRARLVGDCTDAACPASVPGHDGQAASFDGNDAITLAPGARLGNLTNDLTVMAWIRPNTTIGLQNILSADTAASADGFGLALNSQALRFQAYGVHAFDTTQVALNAGQWTHVAAVVKTGEDETAVTFYVNGVAQETLTSTLALAANLDDPVSLGQGWNGLLDEVVVYDRALTGDQLRAIADPGMSGVAAVEVGFLHAQDFEDPAAIAWQPATLAQPGATFSAWSHTLPLGLEGPYKVYLRTTDGLGHTRVISNAWQGDVDTSAPRAVLTHFIPRFPGDRDIYACWSEDYNLSAQGYECPAPTSQAYYQDAAWYTAIFSQTKLWRYISPATSIEDANAADRLTACDLYGACTTVTRTTQSLAWTLGVVILTPTHGSVFTTHTPLQIGGAAYAQAGLSDLSLTANEQVIYTHNWGGSATATPWTTAFTPNTDGAYTLLATIHDTAAQVITSAAPLGGQPGLVTTFYVDATPPQISITTQRITQTNFVNGYVHVTGLVNESVGITRLEAKLNTGDWQPVLYTFQPGWQPWSADLYTGGPLPPAGEIYTLTARVTDVAGNTVETSRVVWADATPPTAFDATLSYYDRQGIRQILSPGDVIDDVLAPTLNVTWTAANDASGLAPYRVRWVEYLAAGEQALQTVDVVAPRSDRLDAGEVQKLAVAVAARDPYGNETVVTVGPVYVDYRLTPVYVGALPPTYPGWQQTMCNQIGVDTRVADHALAGASLSDPQTLYAAWDAEGLRLAWTGANWSVHGDLFVYLDTRSGGSATTYDPYSTLSDTVTLGMSADYAIWVQDDDTATLLRWNGSGWVSAAGLSYTFAAPVTDLFVPFSALGVADAASASLSLVAFANEEAALKVWAALPSANSVNSDLASSAGWEPGVLALATQYTWPALSDGICPSGAAALQANFSGVPTNGLAPVNVVFTDLSSGGATGWQWDFGDGGASTQQHPTHEYVAAGVYPVILTVTGPGGSDTLTRTDYISVTEIIPAPVANFTAAPLTGQPPLTVVFTDTSTGDITGWDWTFGDGGTSTVQHPTHGYAAAGPYTVTLTVTGPGGSDAEVKAAYIHLSAVYRIHLPLVLRNTSPGF